MNTLESPRIETVKWGKMEVENLGVVQDFKLWPGGGRPWDWTETGTHHMPGIQPADIDELLANGSEILVFGMGFDERLDLSTEAVNYLESYILEYFFEKTDAAVKRYNRLAANGQAVGGLFHTTC